jgi:hypothetical protein
VLRHGVEMRPDVLHPMGPPGQRRLCLSYHIISEPTDAADLDLDDVTRDHVPVGSLRAHPEHVARVERGVPAQFLNPGRLSQIWSADEKSSQTVPLCRTVMRNWVGSKPVTIQGPNGLKVSQFLP